MVTVNMGLDEGYDFESPRLYPTWTVVFSFLSISQQLSGHYQEKIWTGGPILSLYQRP